MYISITIENNFQSLPILIVYAAFKYLTYVNTWWFECCRDVDKDNIYGEVEVLEWFFPKSPPFDRLIPFPLLFRDDEIVLILLSLAKLQLHMSSSWLWWVWSRSVACCRVLPLSSTFWCCSWLRLVWFCSVKVVGSLAWPTTARSHLTALVFLGEDRVAALARGPLVGEDMSDDWLLFILVPAFEFAEGCTIVLLVDGRCIWWWPCVSVDKYMST